MSEAHRKNEHPHADVLKAFAEGEPVEFNLSQGGWVPVDFAEYIQRLASGFMETPKRFRVKPPTVNINGTECEKPCKGFYGLTISKCYSEAPTCGNVKTGKDGMQTMFFSGPGERDDFYHALGLL